MNRGAFPFDFVVAEVTRVISTRNPEPGTRNKIRASSRRLLRFLVFGASALMVAALPSPAHACAACFGKSNDAMAQGMNLGIFALLIVIVSVLAGIASFFVFLARRSARFAATAASLESSAVSATETSSSLAETTP